jgi:hypothetical protein
LQELVWSLSYIENENEAYQPHNLRTNMAQWTKKDGKVESVDTTLVYFNIKTHWIYVTLNMFITTCYVLQLIYILKIHIKTKIHCI